MGNSQMPSIYLEIASALFTLRAVNTLAGMEWVGHYAISDLQLTKPAETEP